MESHGAHPHCANVPAISTQSGPQSVMQHDGSCAQISYAHSGIAQPPMEWWSQQSPTNGTQPDVLYAKQSAAQANAPPE